MSISHARCQACGNNVPSFDIIHCGSIDQGYRELCSQCFNATIAEASGVAEFENIRLEPIGIADCIGEIHQFHFRTRLLGDIVSLDAFELRDGNPGGYEFQLIGKPEDDQFALLGKMVQKIRETLAVKYIKSSNYGLQIADQLVKGKIDCDLSEAERMPLLLIDGQEVTWEAFGQMLMSFEGWQFKLEIFDPSDDV
jgi:hypothetical protein